MALAAGFVAEIVANELEEHRRRSRMRIIHRSLRDASDPFDLPSFRFLKLFRLTKTVTQLFIEYVEPHLPRPERSTAIPNKLKILVALHFFGHGSYQLDVGGVYNFGMSQPSVSRSITEVVEIIYVHLARQWIKFPTTEDAIAGKKEKFREKYNFPDTIGAIDCTHVAIVSPPVDHPEYPAAPYYNRKGYYSLNTQIICDADLKILNINARFPGSVHDSAIWNSSSIKNHLRHQYLNDTLTYHLIGDSGYGIQPWLMVPILGAEEGSPAARYNDRLTSARNTIERLNGVLKCRFRCLLKHRVLHYNPYKAAKIIYSCAVLHNIAQYYKVHLPDEVVMEDDDLIAPPNGNAINVHDGQHNVQETGQRKRQNLINTYFN